MRRYGVDDYVDNDGISSAVFIPIYRESLRFRGSTSFYLFFFFSIIYGRSNTYYNNTRARRHSTTSKVIWFFSNKTEKFAVMDGATLRALHGDKGGGKNIVFFTRAYNVLLLYGRKDESIKRVYFTEIYVYAYNVYKSI